MLASEAGLGGFVSTIAATLAGTYVNTELMPQAWFSEDEKGKLPKITTNSSVSYDRNGRGFRAENLDFNKEEVAQLVNEIKARVFDDAFDRNLPTEEAVKEVQKTTKEAEEFLEKEEVKETVKEIKKINSELKKVEEKQKKLEEETPELKTMVKGLSENNSTIDSEKVDEYKKLQEQKEELTKEGLFATQFVYELTEDYANKHSWSEEVKESLQQGFGKLCGFVSNVFDKITGEKVEAMGLAKPVAKIALKAGARSKAGKEFIKFLVKELVKQGLSQGKITEVLGEMGVNLPSDAISAERCDEYDDISPEIFERRVNNDPRQMKLPFGDENQGSSSGDNNGGMNDDNNDKEFPKYKKGDPSLAKSKASVRIEIREKDLNKFGARRKIEEMKFNSKIGNNVLSKTKRDPNITREFRKTIEKKLDNMGLSKGGLDKVDADHIQDLQLGGADKSENLQLLDSGFNRSLGSRIEHATQGLSKNTRIDFNFILKETGEKL